MTSWDMTLATVNSTLPAHRRVVKPPPQSVPDSWDADESESEGDGHAWSESCVRVPAIDEHDNAKIWQEANTKAPMPELVIAPSSTSQGTIAPPSAAFKPALRILKRPSPTSLQSQSQTPSRSQARSPIGSGMVTPPGSQSRGTLAEREAQYLEARNRIFGTSGVSSADPGEVERSSIPSVISDTASAQCSNSREPIVTVIRDPLGPPPESSSHQKGQPRGGFNERRRRRNVGQGDEGRSS
ncbi:hypothetical protein V8B97DRAFT_2004417 [Scleroderma yunnanense]